MQQRNGLAYAVFDKKLDDIQNWNATVRTRVPPLEANTLEELAELMKIDTAEFMNTVQSFQCLLPRNNTKF